MCGYSGEPWSNGSQNCPPPPSSKEWVEQRKMENS